MQTSRVSVGLGFFITIIGLAFLAAGPTNIRNVPVLEVQEIGAAVLLNGIIVMLISVILIRKK